MGKAKKDHARVIAPPPLIYAAAFVPGWYFNDLVALPGMPDAVRYVGAVVLTTPAAGLALGALYLMRKARTAIEPWGESTAIVTGGPFRVTRNPLYVTLALLYAAAALWLDAPLAFATLPLALLVVHYGVIRREERYLERKFGEEYLRYKRSVRRWL